MQNYKVKSRIIDGKARYGIYDEFNEVLSFSYDHILEKDGVYVLKRDGEPDEVFYDGKIIVDQSYNYYHIEVILSGVFGAYLKVEKPFEKKNMQCAIIHANSLGNSICYPFGKATRMEVMDGKVILYNEMKTKTGKGVWGDEDIGTLEPIYEDFQIQKISLPYSIMPDVEEFINQGMECEFCLEDFPKEVILLKYSIKNINKIKYGLKTKLQDGLFYDLFKDYDYIRVDDKEQYFICVNEENGKKTYQLIPYTYEWVAHPKPNGDQIEPVIKIPFQIDQQLEDFFIIPNSSYIEAKVDGKWGVLEVHHQKNSSSYHKPTALDSYDVAIPFEFSKRENIEYIGNHSFIVTEGNQKKVVQLFKKEYCHTFHNELVESPRYPNIEPFLGGFLITTKSGKKGLGSFHYYNRECVFETSEREYDEIEKFQGQIRGIRESEDGSFTFDILKDDSKNLSSDVLEYKNINGYHACIYSDDVAMIFDSDWNIKLLETECVESIRPILGGTLFDVMHTNGTHSVLPRRGMRAGNYATLVSCFGIYDKIHIFPCKKDSLDCILVVQRMNHGMFDTQEYLIKAGSIPYDVDQMVQLFDGRIVDYVITPDFSRTIITIFDSKQVKNVSGVIENTEGHLCLPFEFDSITYQSLGEENGQFIGMVGEEKSYFSKDGSPLSNLNNQSEPQKKIGSIN